VNYVTAALGNYAIVHNSPTLAFARPSSTGAARGTGHFAQDHRSGGGIVGVVQLISP
jgi:hypothetical protein